MEMIQNAYQGFAKQNYTMLDNLKLGYGGTAGEMARLINESGVLGDAIEVTNKTVSQVPFNKVIEAINVIQTRMGITGTTAKEAGQTISGSVGAMKSAWTNLVTGFADGSADIGGLIDDLVTTIVGDGTENNLGVIGNVLPAIERALEGIVNLIGGAAPKIIKIFPQLVEKIVPSLITAATNTVKAIVDVLPSLIKVVTDTVVENTPILIKSVVELIKTLINSLKDEENLKTIVNGAITIITTLANGIIDLLPDIIEVGLEIIVSLVQGISEQIKDKSFVNKIIDVILEIVDILTEPKTLRNLIEASIEIILALALGIIENLPKLAERIPEIVDNIVTVIVENVDKLFDAAIEIIGALIEYLFDLENLEKIYGAGKDIVVKLATGMGKVMFEIENACDKVIDKIFEVFGLEDWSNIGKDIVKGITGGITGIFGNNISGSIVDYVNSVGAGPESIFGGEEIDPVEFDESDYGITTSSTSIGDFNGNSSRYGYGGSQNVNVTVGIDDTANAMGLARELLPFLKIAEKEVYA